MSRLLSIGAAALASACAFGQQTYNAGSHTFTRTGHNQWGAPGEFGLLDYTKKTDKEYVSVPLGIFLPLELCDPTGVLGCIGGLTGAGFIVTLGGALGINFQVWGKDGEINVSYPCGITLTYPDPATLRPGDAYTISSSFTRGSGGSMSTTAPNFGFSLAGLLDASIDVRLSVQLFGEEMAGTDIFNKSVTDVRAGLFNTDLPGFRYLVEQNDGHFELLNGIIEGDYHFPTVNTSGGDGTGKSLASTGYGDFLNVSLSITDAVIAILGLPIDLNGKDKFEGFWGEVSWDLHVLDLRLDGEFGIVQDFKFEPKPLIQLDFSDGTKRIFRAGESINLVMPAVSAGADSNNLTIRPTFGMEGDVTNASKLRTSISLVFDPFSVKAEIKVGKDTPLGFLGMEETLGPIGLDTIELLGFEFDIPIMDKTFTMKGFDTRATTPFLVEGFRYPTASIGQVEPVLVALNNGAFPLTIKGSGFVDSYTNGSGTVAGSTGRVDGSNRTTTYVSSSELIVGITNADTATEGQKMVTVFNPPPGGGSSNALKLIVDGSPPVITGAATPATLDQVSSPKVYISVTVAGSITDPLSGVNLTSGRFKVVDEYGQVQPTGRITIMPNGSYSFTVRLSPTKQSKDKDGRLYSIEVEAEDNLGFSTKKVVPVVVK